MLSEGTLIDNRYRVLGPLGTGGQADVYLAEDTHLSRRVAVKVMHDNFAQDPEFVGRFEREASSAAGLQHKNVVGIYDRGSFGSTYYIVMEYLEGRTLKDVIKAQGALAPAQAIALTEQLLAAAGFAHQRSVIHRDFKPQNVIVDRDGNAKVTDFGIAYHPSSDVTQAGAVLGTAQYISPEVAQGQPPTAASDLYSIGVILFEMLTGRVPFDGDSGVAIALHHVNDPPPRPSALNPSVPAALDEIVLRALAKDPNLRFRTTEEFSQALQQAGAAVGASPGSQTPAQTAATVIATPPPTAPPPPPADEEAKKERWEWWVAAGILAAIAVAVIVFFLLQPAKVTVPYVVGQTVDDAVAKLDSDGLKAKILRATDPAPAGEVIDQNPERDKRVDEGSTVKLTVSKGPGTVKVPQVQGLSQSTATDKLRAVGLQVEVEKEFSSTVDKGLATRTVPGGGATAERGSSVNLFISKGPKTVNVPDVTGMTKTDAKTKLAGLGFKVESTSEDSSKPENQVTDQSPAGNTSADYGSTVTLTVASGSNKVPDVSGLSQNDASAQLKDAGFKVDVNQVPVTKQSQVGMVQSQSPDALSSQKLGVTVTIDVGVSSGD